MKVFVKQYTSYGSFGEKIIPVNQWCDIKVNDINYHIVSDKLKGYHVNREEFLTIPESRKLKMSRLSK